jgi:hypothetical protein
MARRLNRQRVRQSGEKVDMIAALLDRMRELEPEVYVCGPAPEEAIRQLEAAFGHPMPASYRDFLSRFGGVSIVNTVFSGIIDGKIDGGMGWAWTDTKRDRERWQLPAHYLVVEPDEDGPKCLDFSRRGPDGEHPVVYHMPFRSSVDNVAPNFGAWFTESLRCMLEAWDDNGEPEAPADGGLASSQ